MENERPRPKTKGDLGKGNAANPPTPETKLGSATPTPEENDPAWGELGKTRVVEGVSDAPVIGVPLAPSAKPTEPSASRILGKDLLTLGDYQLIKKLGEGT